MRYIRFLFVASLSLLAAVLIYSYRSLQTAPAPSASSPQSSEISTLSPEEQDVEFMTALKLMQGHLVIGKELLEQGTPDQAEPHLGHPIDELYGLVEGQIEQRNAPDCEEALIELYSTAQFAPYSKKVATQYELSMQKTDEAIATLPEDKRQSPKFVFMAINGLLKTADDEYRAGIAGDKVVEAIEYQDARGFALVAQQLYETISTSIAQSNPDVDTVVSESLIKLQTAWPSVNPPQEIVMTPADVSQLIETIRSSSASL